MTIPYRIVAAGLVGCLGLSAERILLQVEDFQGPWRRQTNIPGYVGTGFCTSNANPRVAESVMSGQAASATAGSYAVWVRGYTSESGRRAFSVDLNGTALARTHSGNRRRWLWERAGVVELAAGPCAVIVRDADVGFESADAVLLTDEKEFDPMTEERRWLVFPAGLPETANALQFVIRACCRTLAGRQLPTDLQTWNSRRVQVRQRLGSALGLEPLPERTPLNARVTGRAERDAYAIENVVFESRPRFYVTANLYLPKGTTGPVPGVVVVPGHAMVEGKNYGLYQTARSAWPGSASPFWPMTRSDKANATCLAADKPGLRLAARRTDQRGHDHLGHFARRGLPRLPPGGGPQPHRPHGQLGWRREHFLCHALRRTHRGGSVVLLRLLIP